MSTIDQRIEAVQDLLADAESAYRLVTAGERVSGQAVAALLKRREDLTRELYDLRERLADQDASRAREEMSDEEICERTAAALAALPAPLLDQVLSALVELGREDDLRRALPRRLHLVGE